MRTARLASPALSISVLAASGVPLFYEPASARVFSASVATATAHSACVPLPCEQWSDHASPPDLETSTAHTGASHQHALKAESPDPAASPDSGEQHRTDHDPVPPSGGAKGAAPSHETPGASDPAVPRLSPPHRAYLSRIARRTIRDAAAKRGLYEPAYVPVDLRELSAEVVVQLRDGGFLVAAGVGGPGPVVQATRDAAATAAHTLLAAGAQAGLRDASAGDAAPPEDKDGAQARGTLTEDLVDRARIPRLLVEIEVVGEVEPIPFQGDWTAAGALDSWIEPGVHGLAVIGPRGRFRFCPSELFTSDTTLPDALTQLAQRIHATPAELGRAVLLRFRTLHWYQPAASTSRHPHGHAPAPWQTGPKESDDIVSLHRGLILVPPKAVSPEGLDHAIEQIADYMVYRQRDTGLFTYQYEAGLDRYSNEDSVIRQVGAAAALAAHARWSGSSASAAAADIAIRFHLQGLTAIPAPAKPGQDGDGTIEPAAFITTADGTNSLGVTALLCVALAKHPNAGRYIEIRQKLVNGMLWLQHPSGVFVTAFPAAEALSEQDYFPGEALHALALHYRASPSARVLDAFSRALTVYREYFRGRQDPAFIPWQVQAYAEMGRHSKRKDYADFVFELADWLVERQLAESNCRWTELWGGIAAYQAGRADVATAGYLEALADALALARECGETQRAARYEKAVRAAARFVMQLQVRPEEAYFMRSPRDAVGGIRRTPTLNLLRINHCSHALLALMKTRDALYP